jgi:hypothetical protein
LLVVIATDKCVAFLSSIISESTALCRNGVKQWVPGVTPFFAKIITQFFPWGKVAQ